MSALSVIINRYCSVSPEVNNPVLPPLNLDCDAMYMNKSSLQKKRVRATHVVEPSVDESRVKHFREALNVTNVFARILAKRGFVDSEQVKAFISPSLERDWKDPFLLPDMDTGARRVVEAIQKGESICVFGDYDLDGISATAVMVRGLEALGGDVSAVLPRRLEDGYGLTASAIARIMSRNPQLVVTVDCGISAAEEVNEILAASIDVVITDHHEPGDHVPSGVPVINPKLDPEYSCAEDHLSGSGVALKFIQAVGRLTHNPDVWLGLIDLATLGTIADVMPLIGENRALTAAGLEKMRINPNVGIAALAAVSHVKLSEITAERIAFSLAPRLNAAGRVAHPKDALKLLLTTSALEAADSAELLDTHNRVRQRIEADMFEAVLALLERTYDGEPSIVLAEEGWHDGVKGIVASRIAALYGVPAILCTIENGVAVGSGRSVGSVDLYHAISTCEEHITRFGGHKGAAGLALPAGNIDAFRSALNDYLSKLPPEAFEKVSEVDATVSIDELNPAIVREIAMLEPFGEKNPRPLFYSRAVEIKNPCTVGADGQHLKFQAYQDGNQLMAIYFRAPKIDALLHGTERGDLTYRLELDNWRDRERLQLIVQNLTPYGNIETSDAAEDYSEFLADLFLNADATICRRAYEGILDAPSFNTKVAGVTFENRAEVIAKLEESEELELVREPHNTYDSNAVAVFAPRHDRTIGYLNKDLAAVIAPALDEGAPYSTELTQITGGEDGKNYGVNILISRTDLIGAYPLLQEQREAKRARLRELSDSELDRELTRHFIGSNHLHQAQQESLDALGRGENILTVMATGRGKSLIFHMHAARTVLREDKVSIFVYPLRALVSDQAYHLEDSFADLGIRCAVVTGESSESARAEAFQAIADGTLDIVLTTPEFLYFHADKFARLPLAAQQPNGVSELGFDTDVSRPKNRIGFVVVDEAHHIGQSRAGNRPAYGELGNSIARLNLDGQPPTVLAVTATASDEVSGRIKEVLGISRFILDPSVRDNLVLKDDRGNAYRETSLLQLVATGEKTVIYVNSRNESVKLARLIRKAVPDLAWKSAFYNGGLSRSARHEVERRFRDDEINVIVATSAFGEGINIPNIRNVVLYHMPFSDVEFNQMAGRAGRDSAKATVHLMFGERDVQRNEFIVRTSAPSPEVLALLYRELIEEQLAQGPSFSVTNAELSERVKRKAGKRMNEVSEDAISAGIGVFRELNLVTSEGRGSARSLLVVPNAMRRPLTESVRYSEGLEEIERFGEFKEWVMSAQEEELLHRFNRPILPTTR